MKQEPRLVHRVLPLSAALKTVLTLMVTLLLAPAAPSALSTMKTVQSRAII